MLLKGNMTMKKTLSFVCIAAMLLSVLAIPAFASSGEVTPAISIVGFACDQNTTTNADGTPVTSVEGVYPSDKVGANADPFEMMIIKNTSNADIDLYDGYTLAYNGSNSTTAANFRHQITETTFFGKDWMDGSVMDVNKLPANPDKAVFAPGEVAIIWMYSVDSYNAEATMANFREFWKIPADVLVICADCNSSTGDGKTGANGNFNAKNSDTGTYMICNFKGSTDEKYPADKIYTSNAGQLSVKLGEQFIDDVPEVISYIVLDFLGSNDTVLLTKNQYNLVYKTVQSTISPKWFNATEEGAACAIDQEFFKKAEADTPDTPVVPDTPVDPQPPVETGDVSIALALIALTSLAGVMVAKKRTSR